MVHEEHLRGTGRLPINEYKSRLSVARERGPLIRRFYDVTGNAVRYYNLENIPVAPPHFQWLVVMCLCTREVFDQIVRYTVQISLGNI